MWWTGQNIFPYLPDAISNPDEHVLCKDNFATRKGELSKVVADIKTDAKLLFANKRTVKHST